MQFLYLGPWDHFDPTIHFPNCKKFIYIDVQPRTEWDFYSNTFDPDFYRNNFIKSINSKLNELNFELIETNSIDPLYIKQLCSYSYDMDTNKSSCILSTLCELEINDYLVKYPYITPHLLVYYNNQTKQTIKYYVSTNIKFTMTDELRNDIALSDSLICSGFSPDSLLLNYIVKPVNFYGYTNTMYTPDIDFIDDKLSEESQKLFNYLFFNQEDVIKEHFMSFNVVNNANGQVTKVNSYVEFLETVQKIYKSIQLNEVL